MGHYTDNPVADAQTHIRYQDALIYDFDYNCNACGEGFESGRGFRISDEKFCTCCVDQYRHLEFYRELELSDREIYDITEQIENL